jgi:hypothetical protein
MPMPELSDRVRQRVHHVYALKRRASNLFRLVVLVGQLSNPEWASHGLEVLAESDNQAT